MAFRRSRGRPLRRFKRRWDMQTFRDCERVLGLDVTTGSTCNDPQIFADYLCGIGPSTAPQTKAGASRLVTFGGGHLRVRYNAALFNSTDMPCSLAVKVITAIVKLPLLEDDLTPAYLPNLAIARSQLSVVPSTESDTDEDILYWHDEQLDLFNVSCTGVAETDCTPDNSCFSGDNVLLWHVTGPTAALYGRATLEQEVKAKRRIREREALFLITEFVTNQSSGAEFTWPIHRNAYMRYAIR